MTHHHEHDEHCTCGCHDHHHEHDHDCDCGCHDHEPASPITVDTVDGAIVGSLHFEVSCADRDALEQRIIAELDRINGTIEAEGGIIGHSKAAFGIEGVSKISVIDGQSTVDRAKSTVASGDLVVIAFVVSEERMLQLMESIQLN